MILREIQVLGPYLPLFFLSIVFTFLFTILILINIGAFPIPMNAQEFQLLLQQDEGFNIDFKRQIPRDLGKTICAFANASGGRILIGIDNEKNVVGLSSMNDKMSDVQNIVHTIEPRLTVSYTSYKDVMVITVPEGLNKPYSYRGRFYRREGANSQQLSRDEILEIFRKEGRIQFDETPNPDFKFDNDFDSETFSHFLNQANIHTNLETKDLLDNLELLKDGQIKNAGILLFCRKPTRFFGAATIRCAFFQGKTNTKILDSKEFSADIVSNYENAVRYLLGNLRTRFEIIDAGPRKEILELPEPALREAILNAIAHRDYLQTGASITVYIFSDRVEITNPGGLTGGMTPDMLGKRSIARNNLLFGLMHRMALVEKIGSGINRIRDAMDESNLLPPTFDIDDNWFSIIFHRYDLQKVEKSSAKSSVKSSVKILDLIKENQFVSAHEISKKLGISLRTVEKHLSNLKKKGKLRRIGPAKGGYWEIIPKN